MESWKPIDYLSSDITNLILLNLPAKSLLRFRCVCKSWYSLISDQGFTCKHAISQNDKRISYLVHKYYADTRLSRLYRWNDDAITSRLSQLSDLPPPLNRVNYAFFHGSYNGLVCITAITGKVYLWNPYVKKVKRIVFGNSSFIYLCGVGSCKTGIADDDYKVVKLTAECNKNNKATAHIYTLSTNSWRRMDAIPFRFYRNRRSVSVNGVLHWITARIMLNKNKLQHYIYTFDLQTDVTGEIGFPDEGNNDLGTRGTMCLGNFNGCLSFIHAYDYLSTVGRGPGISIWVMKEYGVAESWTKHFTMKLGMMMECNIWNDQQLYLGTHRFMLGTCKNGLFVYDFDKRERVLVRDESDKKRALITFRSIDYTESLVLLDEEC